MADADAGLKVRSKEKFAGEYQESFCTRHPRAIDPTVLGSPPQMPKITTRQLPDNCPSPFPSHMLFLHGVAV